LTKEYKVIVEDPNPRSDLEGRLETRINNFTVDGWEFTGIFQSTVGIIVIMERKHQEKR
jgi:hypothetical protein